MVNAFSCDPIINSHKIIRNRTKTVALSKIMPSPEEDPHIQDHNCIHYH